MDRLAALLQRSVTDSRSDGQLLAAFLSDRDELAFAELVRRHGPLVWGVCRRSLPDRADAEDAFQAAFLVLVRRAPRLTANPTVGPWLFKVATWTARNLRRKNARQLARRTPLPDVLLAPHAVEPSFELDDLLLALSERTRAAVVLCHLQGLTHGEAAKRLGCPEGTVASLVSRGVAKLRAKFAEPLGVLIGVTVPAALSSATVRSAAAFSLSLPAATPAVVELTEGVLRMFWAKKLATAVAVGMVLIAGLGVVIGVRETPQAVAADDPQSAKDQAEMRRMIEKLAASQEKLTKDVESLMRAQERLTRELVTERGRTPADSIRAVEPSLTIRLYSGDSPFGYNVYEHREPNKGWSASFNPVNPEDASALQAYLTRARRDPNGPKTIRVETQKNTPVVAVKAVARAIRDAGYEKNQVSGIDTDQFPAPKVRVETLDDPDATNVTPVQLNVGGHARVQFDQRILQAMPAVRDSAVSVGGAGNDVKELMLRGLKAGTTDVLVTTADNKKHTLRVTVSAIVTPLPGGM